MLDKKNKKFLLREINQSERINIPIWFVVKATKDYSCLIEIKQYVKGLPPQPMVLTNPFPPQQQQMVSQTLAALNLVMQVLPTKGVGPQ